MENKMLHMPSDDELWEELKDILDLEDEDIGVGTEDFVWDSLEEPFADGEEA